MTDITQGSVETPEEIGQSPRDICRRWLMEIKLASKAEKDWREKASKIVDKYRGTKRKKNSFNILWANTELLRPSIYAQPAKPDVRRRFKDKDPIGKVMSEMLKRSIEYTMDVYDYDSCIKLDVLDSLLPGRGLSRVRYVPEIEGEALTWECVKLEHVQWDDYLHGPGKTWAEVTWQAYRHKLTRTQLRTQFPDVSGSIKLDDADDEDLKKLDDKDKLGELFKTCTVWEIWDKEGEQVIFVSEAYKDAPLKTVADPLGIDGFFCSPRPFYAIEDSSTLIPTPLFDQYEEQAEELDRISTRINKIIDACKVRGIYDSTLSEVSRLMESGDNDLIPAENVTALLERGGLDKAIWMLPTDKIASVLVILYQQRDQSKSVIYEITGISDVLRGSTDPNETKGAQDLKAQFGTFRLKKAQQENQRYVKDLVRIAGQIIAEKFQPETLLKMTGMDLPTEQVVAQQMQQQMAQWQQAAMQAQQQGQQPPPQPEPPNVPTLEKVMSALRDNATRSYKIDIETDSTVAADMAGEMQALQEMVGAVGSLMESMIPAMQAGVVPVEVVKELLGAISRRAKMGNSLEDALESLQAPATMSPEIEKAQAELQKAQQQLQDQQQKMQQEAQGQQQERMKLDFDKQMASGDIDKQKFQAGADLDKQRGDAEMALKSKEMDLAMREQALEMKEQAIALVAEQAILKIQKATQPAETTIANAERAANEMADEKAAQETQASKAEARETASSSEGAIRELVRATMAERELVRGADGRATGVRVKQAAQ